MVLEAALHETQNYHGFRYLSLGEINGAVPGINEIDYYVAPEALDDDELSYRMKFDSTDPTRVRYF